MGFFSNLFASSSPQITEFKITDPKDAYATILVACAEADGEIDNAESTIVASQLMSNPFLNGRSVERLIQDAKYNIGKAGGCAEAVKAACDCIPNAVKKSLFIYASDIILADGFVSKSEEEVLDFLKKNLAISDDDARKIIEVLLMKNKINS